ILQLFRMRPEESFETAEEMAGLVQHDKLAMRVEDLVDARGFRDLGKITLEKGGGVVGDLGEDKLHEDIIGGVVSSCGEASNQQSPIADCWRRLRRTLLSCPKTPSNETAATAPYAASQNPSHAAQDRDAPHARRQPWSRVRPELCGRRRSRSR